MNNKKDLVTEPVVDKISIYKQKLIDRKNLINKEILEMPKEDDFKEGTMLQSFLKYYTTGEQRRLSDTITSTMPLKRDVIQTLHEKQLAIRHLKLFVQNIGVQLEEKNEELSNIDKSLIAIDKGEFDVSLLDNLDLGV